MLSNKKIDPCHEKSRKFQFVFYGKDKLSCFPLTPGKLTIGSGKDASVLLKHSSVDEIHACVIMDDAGGEIVDLNSKHGIFINDEKVQRGRFSLGDRVRIGGVKLVLLEHEEKQVEIEQDIQTLSLTAVSLSMVNESSGPNNGLQLIDGEYCDIVFDDSHFTPLDSIPISPKKIGPRDYIDFVRDDDYAPVAQGMDHVLEVMVSLNGNILSVDYLLIKDQQLYRVGKLAKDNKTIALPCLQGNTSLPFIKIQGRRIIVHQLPEFKGRYLPKEGERELKGSATGDVFELDFDDVLSLEWKTIQVFVRHGQAPSSLKSAPLFTDEEGERRSVSTIFGALMSILLLLLLVDTSRPIIKKENVVIYRPRPQPKLKLPPPVEAEIKVQEKKQPLSEPEPGPEQAKESPPPPPASTPKKHMKAVMSKKSLPIPKKLSKRKPIGQKIVKTVVQSPPPPAPPKKYSFSAKDKVRILFQSAKQAKSNKLMKNATRVNFGASTLSFSRKHSRNKLPASANSRHLGSRLKGRYDGRVDSKGLSSKKAVSSIYQAPPRVTKGSIDPELLRRLLQEYMPQFRHCYQKELQRNIHARGVIDVRFRIVGKGISKVQVGNKKGQIFGPQGVRCISNVLSLIDFPTPKGGGVVDIRQPMNFLSSKVGK